jgi:uncharacterized SAM-binding protein YcdF (DUF218 family)
VIARVLEAPLVIRDPFERLDAIVVLGAPLAAGDRLSIVLDERVSAAAALYHRGGAPLVIPTGGVTYRATRAEAAVMAEALAERGVPDAAIAVEDRALTTADNAARVAAMLGNTQRAVWLVTQPFHGRRARRLFRRAGLDARVWHIDDSIEYRDRKRAMKWLVREYGAWARMLVGRR